MNSSLVFKKLEAHDDRFNELDRRLDKHDHRFDELDRRLDRLDHRLDVHDHRFDEHDHRFDKIDQRLNKLGVLMEEQNSRIGQILEIVQGIAETNVPREEIQSQFQGHDNRISALESLARKQTQ